MNTLPSSRANATTKKLGKVTPGRYCVLGATDNTRPRYSKGIIRAMAEDAMSSDDDYRVRGVSAHERCLELYKALASIAAEASEYL